MPETNVPRQPNDGMQPPKSTVHPFDHQVPTPKQQAVLDYLTVQFKATYEAILNVLPNCRERSVAITNLQATRMWANCATVLTPDDWLDKEGVTGDA